VGSKGTQAIVDGMLAAVQGSKTQGGGKSAMEDTSTPQCSSDFTIQNFAVTYPNDQLIVGAEVTGVPKGATLLGVTVAAAPGVGTGTTYCMGVASDAGGLTLPVSLLGASTSPSFPGATGVIGIVVLAYSQGGSDWLQCMITQPFTVGG